MQVAALPRLAQHPGQVHLAHVPISRSALLALALCLMATFAHAGVQWKWKDANGAVQYSDRPPPVGTPESSILSRPQGWRAPVIKPATNEAASAVATPASAAASAVDPALEARKKKAEEDKQARKKADEERIAAQKADNCQRARGYMRSLQDGMRISRTNANGEREVLDDRARADETERTQGIINQNCN